MARVGGARRRRPPVQVPREVLSYFARGETLDVFDPYALHVTDDDAENAVARVAGGKRIWTSYEWKHDDVPLPPNEDLIIYELLVGDFAGTKDRRGTFEDVVARLDYLKDLGINCLELMPVKFFHGAGWGYNLRSLFGVASTYGSADDLCRLVDECHARGIRVVIDGVYNHADAESPLAKIDYAYWYYEQNPDPPEMQWGPKFNYGHYDENLKVFPARKYVIESIRFWVEKFHIDGIRFDATRAIANFDALHELTAARVRSGGRSQALLHGGRARPRGSRPSPASRTDRWWRPGASPWAPTFAPSSRVSRTTANHRTTSRASSTRSIPSKNGYRTGGHCVNYIVSHDHDRLMQQLGDKGHMFGDVAFARVKLGLGILATIPGVPMIWMGQEFGAASEKSLEPRPLDWSLLENDRNGGLREHVKGLFKLRSDNPALRGDHFEVCFKDPGRRVFAFKRWNGHGGVIVVAVNLKHEPSGEVVIADCGLEDGRWHEYTSNYDTTVEGGVLKTSSPPAR